MVSLCPVRLEHNLRGWTISESLWEHRDLPSWKGQGYGYCVRTAMFYEIVSNDRRWLHRRNEVLLYLKSSLKPSPYAQAQNPIKKVKHSVCVLPFTCGHTVELVLRQLIQTHDCLPHSCIWFHHALKGEDLQLILLFLLIIWPLIVWSIEYCYTACKDVLSCVHSLFRCLHCSSTCSIIHTAHPFYFDCF